MLPRDRMRKLTAEAVANPNSYFYNGVRYALDVIDGRRGFITHDDPVGYDEVAVDDRVSKPSVAVAVPRSAGHLKGRGTVVVTGADAFFVTSSGCLVVKCGVRALRTFATGTWLEAEVKP